MAGKFNLDKIKGAESLHDVPVPESGGVSLGDIFLKDKPGESDDADKTILVKYDDIVPNPENEMSITEQKIREIADSIKNVGQMDALNVVKRDDGKWEILSGETRYRAIGLLRDTGEWSEDDLVEVKPKDLNSIDLPFSDREKKMYMLLSGNINRDKTDADKAFEIRNWKVLIEKLRRQGVTVLGAGSGDDSGVQIAGKRTRDIISEQTGISARQVGKFDAVDVKGIEELKEALLDDRMSVDVAADIAKMPDKKQKKVIDRLLDGKEESEKVTQKDLKAITEKDQKKFKDVVEYGEDAFLGDLDNILGWLKKKDVVVLPESRYLEIEKEIKKLEQLICGR